MAKTVLGGCHDRVSAGNKGNLMAIKMSGTITEDDFDRCLSEADPVDGEHIEHLVLDWEYLQGDGRQARAPSAPGSGCTTVPWWGASPSSPMRSGPTRLCASPTSTKRRTCADLRRLTRDGVRLDAPGLITRALSRPSRARSVHHCLGNCNAAGAKPLLRLLEYK